MVGKLACLHMIQVNQQHSTQRGGLQQDDFRIFILPVNNNGLISPTTLTDFMESIIIVGSNSEFTMMYHTFHRGSTLFLRSVSP